MTADAARCALCRTVIASTSPRYTVDGQTYHPGCWDRKARQAKSHWHRIVLDGETNEEPPLEQQRVLEAISDAMAASAAAAAAERAAGGAVSERPARIYSVREAGLIVWYLDDGALALYRMAGGLREPRAHLTALPDGPPLMRALSGRISLIE